MKKKTIVMLLALCMSAAVLSACNKDNGPEINKESEIGSSTTASSDDPAPEETTENNNDTEDSSWAKENNIEFSDKDIDIKFLSFATAEPGGTEAIDDWTMLTSDTTIELTDVSVSDVDDEGYVTYTITNSVFLPIEGKGPQQDELYCSYSINSLGLMDYYTGTVYKFESLSRANPEYTADTSIEWQDKVYDISITASYEKEVVRNELTLDEDGETSHLNMDINLVFIYSVKVQADYDGIVMYYNTCIPEISDDLFDIKTADSHAFGSLDNESLSDFKFVRINDLI